MTYVAPGLHGRAGATLKPYVEQNRRATVFAQIVVLDAAIVLTASTAIARTVPLEEDETP